MDRLKSLRLALTAILLSSFMSAALATDADTEYAAGVQAAEDGHYAEALQHFSQAATEGHRRAMRAAGLMLLYGEPLYGQAIHQDRVQAMKWLSRAAALDCEVSKLVLKQRDTSRRG